MSRPRSHGFPPVSAASLSSLNPVDNVKSIGSVSSRYACRLNYCLHFLTIYYRTIQDGYPGANPSSSDTIDNVKANIQETDSCPSLRQALTFVHHRQFQGQDPRHGFPPISLSVQQALHLRTPSTTSRPTSKTRIPVRLCGKPSPSDTIDNIESTGSVH